MGFQEFEKVVKEKLAIIAKAQEALDDIKQQFAKLGLDEEGDVPDSLRDAHFALSEVIGFTEASLSTINQFSDFQGH